MLLLVCTLSTLVKLLNGSPSPQSPALLPSLSLQTIKENEGGLMGILEHVGAIAITGLGEDYGKAVVGVAEESLSCSMSSFHVMPLTGGERRTIGADYTTKFPTCIASTMETISAGFHQEDTLPPLLRGSSLPSPYR